MMRFYFCLLLTTVVSSLAYAQREATIGTVKTFNASTTAIVRVVGLDDTHVLIVYKDGSVATTSDMYAVVGEVDTNAGTISLGTAALIEADAYARHSVLALSSTTVVVFYEADLTNDEGHSRVITVDPSSNSVTNVGSAVTFHAGDVDAAGSHIVQDPVKLTSSTFALVFVNDESTDDGTVVIGTVSGSSISYGSPQVFSTGDVQHISMTALSSTKVAISFEDDGTSLDPGKVVIGEVSGNTVSFGSEYTFHSSVSASATSFTSISAISSTQFFLAYTDDGDSDHGNATVGTVSGTEVTFSSTPVTFEPDQIARDITTAYLSGNEVAIGYNGGASNTTKVLVAEVSGTGASATIAFNSYDILTGEGDDSWITRLNDDAFVFAYIDESNTADEGEILVATLPSDSDPVSASISGQTNVDCNGDSSGSLTATATDGTPNYSYAWSNGASTSNTSSTTNTINSLAAGTYTVTITDSNGETSTASSTITQPTALSTSASVVSGLACNGDTNGQVMASPSGGTSPYTYSWNTGGTSLVETGLGAGTYSVTVTDNNGCTDATTVELTEPTALSTSASVTSALNCNGDTNGQVTASPTGGTSPYTYSWNTGSTSATETGLGAGTYSVTVTDNNGCTDATTVELTEPAALVASAVVSSSLACNGDTDGQVTASQTGGTAPYTYNWNTGGTTITETGLGAGTYSVTVTDNNGCTDATTVELTEPEALSASASVTSALNCNGDTNGQVTASQTGGTSPFTYSWNTGGTSATETGLGAGTYSVTVTDNNGCTDATTVELTEPEAMIASASVTSALNCNGDTNGQVTASQTGGTSPFTYSWNTGGTSATETGLGAGTYSVTVTDNNGCTDATTVELTEPEALSASASVTSALNCNGDTNGQVTASQTGGTSPFTYSWNTGGTSATETGLGAGTYSVTVTDNNGCTDATTVELTEPAVLEASASVTGILNCNGDTDGQVTASQTGGTSPYTYAWNTGGTSATETGLGAGTYTVTVTDNNGCTDATTVELTEPAVLEASASVTGILNCNGDTDGQVSASQTGGTSPYTYAWNTGGTSATETGLGAGTYTVTVTDNNGCTDATTVELTEPAVLEASASVTGILNCNGDTDGQVTASQTGGTSPYTYAWNTGGTSATETGLGAGTYTVTVTDNNGCTDATTVELTEPEALSASASVTSALSCNGDTNGQVTASQTGGTSPFTYSWNTGGTSATETGLGAGTYSVTVTDNNGCTDATTVELTEPEALSASASVTGILNCNGDTDGQVTASQTGGTSPFTYAWNTGGTSATETGLGAGTYTVTVTDNNGCTDATTVELTEPAVLEASASVTGILNCNGDTNGQVTASQTGGTSPYTYAWNTGGTSATETGLGAGTYTVTVTDNNGCTDATTVELTEPAVLEASASVTGILNCNGDTDGQVTASQTGGTSPYTYAWNTGGTSATETGLGAGTYTVTVTDNNGCTDATTVELTEPAVLEASASVTGILNCNGATDGQVTASQTGGTSPYTYAWNTGGTSATETGLGAGTYTVTVTDNNGCTDATTVELTEPAVLEASASVTGILNCNGDTDGQVTANQTGGTSPYTYAWNTGGTSATETGLGAGTYTVTVTDNNGCTDATTVELTEPAVLEASASVTGILNCNGDTDGQVTASQTGGTSPYTYAWNTGGTSATETGLGAGTYTVTVTDNNGCTDATTVELTEPAVLEASASVTGILNCNGDTDGQVTASQTGGTSPYTYAWNTGGTSATETGLGAGTYTVTVTDNNGCTDATTVELTEPAVLEASASVTGILNCNGDTDGQVTASQTGGTSPYTYAWNTGGTSATETGLGAGTYTVTVTDNNGCTDATTVELTEPAVLEASASVTGILNCNGDTDGQVTASQTGGTSPYTYAWNTGGTSATETGLGAGTYTVTVTDNNGCTDATTVELTEPALLEASISSQTNVTNKGGSDGSATASGSGGTSPYTYAWSTGGNTATIGSLSAGTYTVSITDGNGCGPATKTVTITEPANTAPVITSSASVDFAENGTGTAYTVTTTDAESDEITYSLGSGNDEALFSINGSSGIVTFITPPDYETPGDGDEDNDYIIEVKADDGTDEVSKTVTITVTDVDEIAPDKPVITGISDDTGTSNTDGVTSDRNLLVSGTSEPNALIKLYAGGTNVNNATADANGDWTVDVSHVTLPNITFNITVTATDQAGNTSGSSDPYTVKVDFTAPDKPVITSISDDTGTSDSDGVTSDRNLMVSGTSEPNALIKLYAGGTNVNNATADANGDWTVDVSHVTLPNITFNVTVTATDQAGNVSGTSDPYAITVDYNAPDKPVITGISDDTGTSDSDGITSDRNLMVSGTSEANALIKLYKDGFNLGNATADANGDWTVDVSHITIPNTTGNVTVTATDKAGNLSDASDPYSITVDYIAPAKPVITGISDDTGTSSTDGITSDRNITMSGTSEANALIEISKFGFYLGSGTADANGDWTVDLTHITIDNSTSNVVATAIDKAGNESDASDPYTFTVDYNAPAKPVITGISDDTGTSSTDGITSDRNLIVSGTSEANALVKLYKDGFNLGNATADENGDWTVDVTHITIPNTTGTVSVTATDKAGNVSDSSDPFAITIDYRAPTVSLSAPSEPLDNVFTVTAQFSEAVTDFSLDDVTVTEGSSDDLVSVDADTYTFTVTSSNATAEVRIAANLIEDLAGNLNQASNTLTLQFGIPLETGPLQNLTRDAVKPEEVKIYPNPASDVLTIDLRALKELPVGVSIYNAEGANQLTLSGNIEPLIKVDVSSYTQGLYLVLINDGKNLIQKRLMIRR